ncbi:glucan endo-1,3-beta-glucosidase 1 isoform X2 [Raphanus sativus]|uniref:Glucan endo-1,3-beta-glucosidase 1 isoform X2 n=1 Tax=Raphanus sativus TaxID=3726 RepID=A0A9W3DSU7_RAPSA|nr:glucan endo-1,3-beta-glucosidase 1 isoform X2 [Raphanus sativus]
MDRLKSIDKDPQESINTQPFTSINTDQPEVEASSGRWCVANPHIPDQVVQAAAEWACQQSVACCSRIQLGQNCFLPNTIKDHASVVFNTYYQNYKHQGGSCDFNGAAVITDTDPSHGSCQFESAPDSK